MQIKFLTILLLMGVCAAWNFKDSYLYGANKSYRWWSNVFQPLCEDYFNRQMWILEPDWTMGQVSLLQNKTLKLHNTASKMYSDYFNEHVNALYYPGKAQEVLDELRAKGAERNEEIRQRAEDIGADIILACLADIDEHFKDEYEKIRLNMDNCAINAIKRANETFKAKVLTDVELRQANENTRILMDCFLWFNYSSKYYPKMSDLRARLKNSFIQFPKSIKAKINHIPGILDKLDKEMEECLNGKAAKDLINNDVVEVAECAAVESGKNVFDEFTGKVFD